MKIVVLMNLGTPLSPAARDVKAYLREFLMDPYVLDIPRWQRWLLVEGLILPFRPARSAKAYAQIWSEAGSPLRIHLESLKNLLQLAMGEGWKVYSAMRYGTPSLQEAAQQISKQFPRQQEVLVAPLYPQYALSSTESSIQHTLRVFREFAPAVRLKFLPPFYRHPAFVEAFSKRIQGFLEEKKNFDAYLFSFHGLPERQIHKTEQSPGEYCLRQSGCCDRILESNAFCYRAQCFETARLIAEKMSWSASKYHVGFQSRLGRTPWIQPFTDVLFEKLAQQGARRLCVICPSFVADCLETLEEIEIRGREQFLGFGGEALELVPSLNADPQWVRSLSQILVES